MEISELILKNRSYRRFDEAARLSREELLTLADAARLSSCAGNLQRLRFALVTEKETCDAVFPLLRWAAYFGNWSPAEGERPAAYLIVLTQKTPDVALSIDIGIAAEAMLLRATERGIGGCMLRSYDREALTALLNRPGYAPELVIALGKPAETVKITEPQNGDLKYYRLPDGTHCVPKLPLSDLIL